MKSKICLIVLDGLGVGALPDAKDFGDKGANTLLHVLERTQLNLPNLQKLGLYKLLPLACAHKQKLSLIGSYGKMAEISKGKDSTTGHWEITGLSLEVPFPTYPGGFPSQIIKSFEQAIGRKVIGNKTASGTEIIRELGELHLRTGRPIVYTSADSVFQVAAHVEVIPIKVIYKICETARGQLIGEHKVARVIARPFAGNKPSDFSRLSAKRKDYAVKPPHKTLLDLLSQNGVEVHGVGKISEIFAGQGIDFEYKTKSNRESTEVTLKLIKTIDKGFIFTNLVDFDMLWGHRNDFEGYARSLKEFDGYLPLLERALKKDDILIITSDHGCDPLHEGTDHTREYVPVLVYGKNLLAGENLGTRKTFADAGQTVAEYYKIKPLTNGESFLKEVCKL